MSKSKYMKTKCNQVSLINLTVILHILLIHNFLYLAFKCNNSVILGQHYNSDNSLAPSPSYGVKPSALRIASSAPLFFNHSPTPV